MKCKSILPDNGKKCIHYQPEPDGGIGFCGNRAGFLCTEAMKHKLPPVSYSQLTDWASCKMKYYCRVVMGLKPSPQFMPEPMKMGNAWDKIMNHVYGNTSPADLAVEIDKLQLTDLQRAKLRALMKAHRELIDEDTHCEVQHEMRVLLGNYVIIGYIDRLYDGYHVDSKLSSRPDFYTKLETVSMQQGTYFLDDDMTNDYVVMEITRVPQLKQTGRFSDESPEDYEKRVFGDILSRPSYYFQGYDRKKRTFGTKFYKSEFPLDEIRWTFKHVIQEIKDTLTHGRWYKNRMACYVPTPCTYLPYCNTGVISDDLYLQRGDQHE